jgi:hypothetical protein
MNMHIASGYGVGGQANAPDLGEDGVDGCKSSDVSSL